MTKENISALRLQEITLNKSVSDWKKTVEQRRELLIDLIATLEGKQNGLNDFNRRVALNRDLGPYTTPAAQEAERKAGRLKISIAQRKRDEAVTELLQAEARLDQARCQYRFFIMMKQYEISVYHFTGLRDDMGNLFG